MPSTTFTLIATTVLAAEADWVFTWPYNADGSCRCEEKDFGLQTFLTEENCLQAFVESEYEYCSYQGRALVEKQCDFAVSVTEGLHNTDCAGRCSEVIAGLLSVTDYMKECDLEVVVDFDFAVATLSGKCYSNKIFGWSDYNPNGPQRAPLRFIEGVSTAARCQELCQDIPECASFVWRAYPEHDSTVAYQNEPHTCILYDEEFMNHVVSDPVPSSFGNPTEFCNVPAVGTCASIKFPRSELDLMEDQTCLYCGCEPRCIYHSESHVTGPSFCRRGVTEVCDFTRPSWTTTTPEPECPTETCVVPDTTTTAAVNTEEGTSVTDVALTTTSAVVATTTTNAAHTTTPYLTQMTAESDTALTTTTGVSGSTTVPPVTVTLAGSTEETETTVLLETTEPVAEETTTGIVLETTTGGVTAPTTAPGASTTAPGEGTPAPGASTTAPGEGTPAPGASTTAPGEGTPAPGASTTAPGEGTPAPGASTTAAGEGTPAPGASTTAPGEGTPAPGASTTAPGEGTPAPGASTTAPGEGTPAPGASTTAPGEGTPAPGESTTAPGEGTPAPGESTTAPGEGTPAPGASTTAPGEATVTPVGTPEVPTTGPVVGSSSTTKTVPGGCVPDCPDCPCFVESECDDCYSISDCMDDEC